MIAVIGEGLKLANRTEFPWVAKALLAIGVLQRTSVPLSNDPILNCYPAYFDATQRAQSEGDSWPH